MSKFFSQIEEIFDNQTKEVNFEKINNHYKDKTFRFDINDQNSATNCFLSRDNEKNFKYLQDLEISSWIEEWRNNNYEKFQNFDIRDTDLDSSFNVLQKFDETKNIKENEWKQSWKVIIKKVNENEKLLKKLFKKIFKPRLKQKYSNKSEYLNAIDSRYEYKSISSINKNYKIFENKINCTNVEQGELGTCYFLETLSTLSNFGHLLYQLFPKEKINSEGLYEICLFDTDKKKWIKVLVDDYFVFFKDTDTFAFCQPVNDCLYSCFLEKAYAKIKGSYVDINGSYMCDAFEALTGFKSFMIETKQLNEKIYNYIYNKIDDGYLFSCCTRDHAYSIISILDDKSNKIFQVRNPWNFLPKEDLEMYNSFFEKNPKYKRKDVQKDKEKEETGIFFVNKEGLQKYFRKIGVCEILFDSSIYYYELNNISYRAKDKFYIYFEIFEDSKISFDMYDNNKIGWKTSDNFQVGLKDMMKKDNLITFPLKTIRYYEKEMSFDLDNYHKIPKSKYLLKIDFLNKNNIKSKILKIILGGNVTLKYLGCHSEDPEINSEQYIEFKKYHYGEETDILFKKYRNIIRLLKEEFKVEMSPNARGYYIETIFTNEIETIIKFDKEKLINQICSYDKKEDVYFIGNKHSNGKIEDDNGKALILVDDEFHIIYRGKIDNNKICILFINLDKQLEEAILKLPNISIFNPDSEVHCPLHQHNMKYRSAQGKWTCKYCSRTFDKGVDSFECKTCNFFLCLNCLFNENNYSIKIELEFKIKNKKINEIRLFGEDFARNNKRRKIFFNGKEFKLDEFIPITNASQNKNKLEVILKEINKFNSMQYMFCNRNFTKIKFCHLNPKVDYLISTITSMHGMFYNCSELEEINLSIFDTSNVTDMRFMFYNCNYLKEIKGIEQFNTKQVKSMGYMFFGCKELIKLDLSRFDTSNVFDMSFMFFNNSKLKEIEGINYFNTQNVTLMSYMFSKCKKLEYLDLSNFNISKVKNMDNIFCGCDKKKIIGINKFYRL